MVAGDSRRKKLEIPLSRFANGNEIVALLQRYSARHTVMTEHRAQPKDTAA